MAPPRTYRCDALTLKETPLGEADLLVNLYTREHGTVRAVAVVATVSVTAVAVVGAPAGGRLRPSGLALRHHVFRRS